MTIILLDHDLEEITYYICLRDSLSFVYIQPSSCYCYSGQSKAIPGTVAPLPLPKYIVEHTREDICSSVIEVTEA